ncbi:MAG: HAD hydrolase family protein [Acidobacteriota bacterium]
MSISPLPSDLTARASALRWLLFDVDGVLTDGRLWYSAEGETLKAFHVRDGLAIRMAQRVGLKLGLFSGRRSAPLERRARDLDFDTWILGSGDKGADLETFLAEHDLPADAVAFVGDDLIDLPVIHRVGLSFAPADAVVEVCDAVDHVLATPGGHGAVREMIDLLLRARGEWQDVVARWRDA